jgi:hypothetical protein
VSVRTLLLGRWNESELERPFSKFARLNYRVAAIKKGNAEGYRDFTSSSTLETSDEHLIYCQYRGLRHGKKEAIEAIARDEVVDIADYYMRISLQFETGSEKYYWLNNIIAVGIESLQVQFTMCMK